MVMNVKNALQAHHPQVVMFCNVSVLKDNKCKMTFVFHYNVILHNMLTKMSAKTAPKAVNQLVVLERRAAVTQAFNLIQSRDYVPNAQTCRHQLVASILHVFVRQVPIRAETLVKNVLADKCHKEMQQIVIVVLEMQSSRLQR